MTRKSKREIERELDAIEEDGDLAGVNQQLTLAELLSYEFEPVTESGDVVRLETGELRRWHPPESDDWDEISLPAHYLSDETDD